MLLKHGVSYIHPFLDQPYHHLSRLPRPNLIRDRPDKLQLLPHILVPQRVTFCMASEATLRRNGQPLQRLLPTLLAAFSDVVGGFVDAVDHLLLVLELGKFGGHDADDDVLVVGEVLEGLEAAGARGVVFEVVAGATGQYCVDGCSRAAEATPTHVETLRLLNILLAIRS